MKSTLLFTLALSFTLKADVTLPNLYSDNAVIQRNVPFKVWGWAAPAEEVTVHFVGSKLSCKANEEGNWSVTFPAQKAGGPYKMVVEGKNTITRENLMFGEVWVCSGQSNMQWNLLRSVDGDVELLLAKDKDLRIITVTNDASQSPVKDIDGVWSAAIGDPLKDFSAVGYYFGRALRRALGVPVGLINNSWGGSAIEAWIPRSVLMTDERNNPYLEIFAEKVAKFKSGQTNAEYKKNMQRWEGLARKARNTNQPLPRKPREPRDPTYSQHRPANLWNGRVTPLLNYAIKGVIWYQGEANTWDRAYHYRNLLPMLIKTWRQKWNLGDFPFYWSQLADFAQKRDVDGFSPWAEIRESMTLTMMNTKNTGQAVITDLGEDADIHPRKKFEVARRLVRWALAKDYGFDLVYSSPMYESHEIVKNKIIVKFDQKVKAYETKKVWGFTVAGKDQKFKVAQGRIKNNIIEIWSDEVKEPVALRYNWAGNPIGNIISLQDLPLTPFRTDRWKLGSE